MDILLVHNLWVTIYCLATDAVQNVPATFNDDFADLGFPSKVGGSTEAGFTSYNIRDPMPGVTRQYSCATYTLFQEY